MIGEPLPGRVTGAVRNALLSHGWGGVSSQTTAESLEPWAHHLTRLTPEQVEGLLRAAPKFGIDLLTGDDWALLLGTRARLSALARSWTLPSELQPVAVEIGTGLPAEEAMAWRTGGGVIDLASGPAVFEALPQGVIECDVRAPIDTAIRDSETGILLVARDPARALDEMTAAIDRALTAGMDLERIVLDPGWSPGAPSLGLFRRFGRPLLCTTDDPVAAVLARQLGAQLFRTRTPAVIARALSLVQQCETGSATTNRD